MKPYFKKFLILLSFLGLSITSALAVHDLGLFELDGNALQEAAPGDDWETLYLGGGSAIVTTDPVIIPDPAPQSIFIGGGSKDTRNIDQWKHTTGSVPDKDDLTNAYAAAYEDNGDLVIYFGADRFSNDGDAQMAFWFFQDEISLKDDGTFSGLHTIGDVLIVVLFQGGGDIPSIQVYEWVGSGGSEKQGGTLDLVLSDNAAKCGNSALDSICAITNDGTTTSPWPYVPKANVGVPGIFIPQGFFEGGINITEIFGSSKCFASFLAETRSSSSVTAQLKDFVLGAFPLCRVKLSKVCQTGTLNTTTGNFEFDYTVKATNEGFAVVDSVIATDDSCTPNNAADDVDYQLGPIAANGGMSTAMGTCSISPAEFTIPVINSVTAVASSGGGDIPVILANTCITDPSKPGSCGAICPVELSPQIEVTKKCVSRLEDIGDTIAVKINFAGDVCNTSDQTSAPTILINVSVTDDKAGGPLELFDPNTQVSLGTSTTLNPGECANYVGSYLPNETNSICPEEALFMNTVTGTGTEPFTQQTVEDMATDSCDLCPGGDACENL